MPMIDFEVQNNIFYCREVGRVNLEDAERYVEYIAQVTEADHLPIVVFIDAREAEFISPNAANIFVESAKNDNIICYVVVINDLMMKQTSRILAIRNPRHNTRIFDNYDDAYTFAVEQAHNMIAMV